MSLLLFFKGFLVGMMKIVPGASGAVLAISLGVYNKALESLNLFFKKPWEAIKFLGPFCLGVLLAILVFSRVVLYFLGTFPLFTMAFFLGLIIGTLPSLIRDKAHLCLKDYVSIFFLLLIMLFILKDVRLDVFKLDGFFSYFFVFFLGVVEALAMIIPGLSGTLVFMMLGSYEFVLTLFANPLGNIFASFLFILGCVLGIFFLARLITYLFINYEHVTWVVIMAFIFLSLLLFGQEIIFSGDFRLLGGFFWLFLGIFLMKMAPLS